MAANGQMQQQQPLMPGMGNAMSGMMGRPPASPYGATMQPQQDKSGGQAPGTGMPGMGGPEGQQDDKSGGQVPGNVMRGIDPNFGGGVGMHAGGTPGFYNNQPPVSVGPTWEHRGY